MSVSVQNVADVMKVVVTETSTQADIGNLLGLSRSVAGNLDVPYFIDSGLTAAQEAMTIRGEILRRIDLVAEVCAFAASRGYLLPENPFPRIEQVNRLRRPWQSLLEVIREDEFASLTDGLVDLCKVAKGYEEGTVTFDRQDPAAQIASFEMSVDGIAQQSGDALVDILGYQPDADSVKKRQALDTLAKLDFTKRKPYLLFTADVIRNGRRELGTVVCWQRMRDASGYTLTKRDVFALVDYPPVFLTNAQLEASTAELARNAEFMQVMSFYDWVGVDGVFAFLDESTGPNTLYSYRVSGVQRKAPASLELFDVPSNSLYLTADQVEAIRAQVQRDLRDFSRGSDMDSISPYPAISQVIYGDPGYAWAIAGMNVLAAKRRGDEYDRVKAYSYVGSKLSDLLAQAAAGRLYVPQALGSLPANVESSIASYGISQTLLAIIDGTGLTFFVSGKDEASGFQPSQESLEDATSALARILSAIDPATATVDPKLVAANLSTPATVTGPPVPRYETQGFASTAAGGSQGRPTPPNVSAILNGGILDLTTYKGIGDLMTLVRSLYDFYPGLVG